MNKAAMGFSYIIILYCFAISGRLDAAVVHSPSNQASLPAADGNLNIYVLPTGQGDSHIIQCPDGVLSIVDLGSTSKVADGFWRGGDIKEFLNGQENRIRNILVSHNHWDHYSLLVDTFGDGELEGLQNMYISCTYENMAKTLKRWVDDMNINDKLKTFNGGQPCGPKNTACESLDICPSSAVSTITMAANLGNCEGLNKNIDSTVFKLKYGTFSMLFTGDFEDFTSDWGEDGPQKWLVDHWKSRLVSTVYQIAHHAAESLANKPVMRDAIKPKALVVSADPFASYRHPRCSVIDAFINYVGSLCKPSIQDPTDGLYCGEPVNAADPPSSRVQRTYTCGFVSNEELEKRTDNDYAIYTSGPDGSTRNLITIKTDGAKWQIKPSIDDRSII